MNETLNALLNALNKDNVNSLSQMTGLDQEKTTSAISQILPALLQGLSQNVKQEGGLSSLENALAKDHNGSILNNVMSAFMNGDKAEDTGRDTNGLGIINHIFGGQQNQVAQNIGSNLNIDSSTIMSLMAKIAPLVMGFLGKSKNDGGMDIGSLLNMATTLMGNGGNQQAGGLGSLLDLGSQLLGGNSNQQNAGGGLAKAGASLLKGLFGGKK